MINRFLINNKISIISIINCFCIILLTLTSIYHIFSLFPVTIYPFNHKVTNYFTISLPFINQTIDDMIFLMTLITISLFLNLNVLRNKIIFVTFYISILLFLFFYDKNLFEIGSIISFFGIIITILYDILKKKNFIYLNFNALVIIYSFTTILLGIIALLIFLSPILHFEDQMLIFRNNLYEIFLFFSSFSPWYISIILLTLPIKELVGFSKVFKIDKIYNANGIDFKDKKRLRKKQVSILLMIILVFSICIVLVPHIFFFNKENKIIATDTANYGYTIRKLNSEKNLIDSVVKAFEIKFGSDPKALSGERPLTLIFIMIISKIVPIDVDYLIDIVISSLLSPLLVISIYFLTRELTQNETMSLIASFLTSISPQVLIGIYSGYYANWLALVLGFFSFYFLIKYLKSNNNMILLLFFMILAVLTKFTHTYTWVILSSFFIVFSLVITFKNKDKSLKNKIKTFITIVLIILIPIYFEFIITFLNGSALNSGQLSYLFNGIGLQQFVNNWSNLSYAINLFNGGIFSNFIILGLCMLWIYYFNKSSLADIFIIVILTTSLIPIFFGNSVIQSRILYIIPFQLPAAIALNNILYLKYKGSVLFFSIIFCLIIITIRTLSNFVLMID